MVGKGRMTAAGKGRTTYRRTRLEVLALQGRLRASLPPESEEREKPRHRGGRVVSEQY